MGYVIYALETTGPDPETHRITRVFGRKLDHEFNILDTVDASLKDNRSPLSTYDLTKQVHDVFNAWSPAIFIGYGSLKSHERFLRNALESSLFNPFLTISGSNGRSDVVRHLEAAVTLAPAALVIPRNPDRTADMSIAAIAAANSLPVPTASNAEREVDLSIDLCKRIYELVPEATSSCARLSFPASVTSFLEDEPIVLWTNFSGGRSTSMKIARMQAQEHMSRATVFNLAVDPAQLMKLTDEQLAARLSTSPRPIWRVATRHCPLLAYYDKGMPAIGVGGDELLRRANVIKDNKELLARLMSAATKDAGLPSGNNGTLRTPLSESDRDLRRQFHEVPWNDRIAIAHAISDATLRETALSFFRS